MLVLKRYPNEVIVIEVPGHTPIEVMVTRVSASDRSARIGITAPSCVKISRLEHWLENQKAKPVTAAPSEAPEEKRHD